MNHKEERWRTHFGDCMDYLRQMQSASVDAVVTDPPYMVGATSVGDIKTKAGSWVDLMNASFWYSAWLSECYRAIKPTGYLVVFLNWRSLPVLLKACSDASIPASSCACWNKKVLGTAGPTQLRPAYEMLLFCAGPEASIKNRSQPDYFEHQWMSHWGQGEHRAQKPIELVERLVGLVTERDGVVLDPFMGSGTTGIAAIKCGRRFIGMEGDPNHYEKAVLRIQQAANPMTELNGGKP